MRGAGAEDGEKNGEGGGEMEGEGKKSFIKSNTL